MDLLSSFEETSFEKITKLQSLVRKSHVLNEMLKVRNDYEKLFAEIEGSDSDTRVEWRSDRDNPDSSQQIKHTSVLSYPKFVPKNVSVPNSSSANSNNKNSKQMMLDKERIAEKESESVKTTTKNRSEPMQASSPKVSAGSDKLLTNISTTTANPVEPARSSEVVVYDGGSTTPRTSRPQTNVDESHSIECELRDDADKVKFLQLENLKSMKKKELLSVREGVALELLWIDQAIQSRVQYLRIKQRMQCKQKKSNASSSSS